MHSGAFVWGDNRNENIASIEPNQFIARAGPDFAGNGGGFFLQSDSSLDDQGGFLNTSTGGHLTTGGAWTNASDRNQKTSFAAIEPASVLAKVAELPLSSWEYKAEPGARHLGPTAQDFYRAFGLGSSDRHIASLDSAGVALGAIKGLKEENDELRQRLEALEAELAGAATAGSGGTGSPGAPILAGLGIALLVGLGGFATVAALRRRHAQRVVTS